MFRKRLSILSFILVLLSFTGCGLYDKDYYSESEYIIDSRIDNTAEQSVSVSNISELENAIIDVIVGKAKTQKIVFSSYYNGDAAADLSLTCKNIMTRNPLCAYCVESIDYDIYKVLAYDEAVLKINFARSAVPVDDIYSINYIGSLSGLVKQVFMDGKTRIAVLVNHSSYDSDDIEELILDLYNSSPLCVPCEPDLIVSTFSGNGSQKLYEININYGVSNSEFSEFKSFVDDFYPLNPDIYENQLSELEICTWISSYLINNCSASSASVRSSAYYTLSEREGDSKGLSLAFSALSELYGLECKLVNGQREWKNHYWNIVKIDDAYYHIDIERCITEGLKYGFLLNDDNMWKSYRWNLSGYPQCNGNLTYQSAVLPDPKEEKIQ